MADDGSINPPRNMTADERQLLDYMIGLVPHAQAELRRQASAARVSGTCVCGCGTFDLVVDPEVPSAFGIDTPASDAVGQGDDHVLEVLLFTAEGRLGGVEIVRYGDVAPGKPLPVPMDLEPIEWSERDERGGRHALNTPRLPEKR